MKPIAYLRLGVIGLLMVTMIGCQATRRGLNFETSAAITISADAQINPDQDNRASPVVIRVFKLTDARQFQREEFLNLYENPQQRLGNDLIDVVILKELVPGESRQEIIPLTPEIRYLGFMAEFMQYQDSSPIVVVPIKDHNKNKIKIRAQGLQLFDSNQPATLRSSSTLYRDGRSALSKADSERRNWENSRNALKD